MRFALLLLLSGTSIAAAANRPNVIFFLSDDHRAGFLGCAGHPVIKTPTIDRLAANGVRFENTFATTAICAASRATLFTGLFERTHGYTFGTPPLRPEHVSQSYPAVLREAGYRTGFVGKFGVGVEKGAEAELFDVYRPRNRAGYFKPQPDGSLRHETELDADDAIEFLKTQPRDQPFCLSVSFNAAHAEDADKLHHFPWIGGLDGLYDDVSIDAPRLNADAIFESHPEFLKQSLNRERWFWRWDTPAKYQHNIRAYYRLISSLDFAMFRVLAELERQGFAGNTVVIFSGDNGYYAGERQFAGKWTHFEQSLRVPLVIYDPHLEPRHRGRVVSAMTLNLDIPPTILRSAGVEIPAHYQGRPLNDLMAGGSAAGWRTDFFCEHLMNHPQIPKWEGVRDERYVYARYFEQQPPVEFLHDLEADPDELRNLADDPNYRNTLERFRTRMQGLRDGYGGEYVPRPRIPARNRRANSPAAP